MTSVEILSFSDHRVGAVLSEKAAVRQLQDDLLNERLVQQQQLTLLGPQQSDPEKQLISKPDPELASNMLNWHIYLGAIGLILAFLLAGWLVNYGPMFTQANPYLTFIALLSPGLFLGLFASGLVSLRPDKDPFNQAALSKVAQGKWLLIICANNEAHRAKLMSFFRKNNQINLLN